MASARVYTEQVAVKTECVGETPLTGARKYDQATPVLNVMPWLPVCRRIDILAQNNSNVPFQNFLPPLPFFRSGVPAYSPIDRDTITYNNIFGIFGSYHLLWNNDSLRCMKIEDN